MTYAKGSGIQAADFNTFAGVTGAAAPSALVAQNKAGYLYGIGFGDRGYGQTTPALTATSSGNAVDGEWQNLRTILASMASWQNTSTALLPPSSSFNVGANIVAHESSAPSLNAYDIQDMIAALDTNRFNYQIGNMTLSTIQTSTRGSTWGDAGTGITAEFQVVFNDENNARYFFNTGGEFRVTLSHPNVSNPRNQNWNTILNGFTLAFRANTSVRTGGSFGTAQSIGYYQLTTAYQTICDGTNIGITPYTSNDFYVEARATTIAGVNGAKGSTLQFRVRLIDEQQNGFDDLVASGTVSNLQQLRATSGYVISAPTSSIITAF
jgi:hypothetical protein